MRRYGGLVLALVGVLRLLMEEGSSVLGIPISCGTALAYLTGADAGHPVALLVCTPTLHNASLEGLVLLVGGILTQVLASHRVPAPNPTRSESG